MVSWRVRLSTSDSGNSPSSSPLKRKYAPPTLSTHSLFGDFGADVAKVDFFVNGDKVDYAMKVGEGGEAFFVFQTDGDIPEDMQTSPVVSPVVSPVLPDANSSVTTTSPLGPCFCQVLV
jgi:lipin, N-terminal conserved region